MNLGTKQQDIFFEGHRFTNLLLILSMLLFLSSCSKEEEVVKAEPVKPVKIYTVQTGKEEVTISLPGRIRAARRSELSFKVSGPLMELPVVEGQHVKKGDLIAKILPRDFQTAVNEAKAQELEAKQQYRRYKELYAKKQVSKADFDRYRAARDVARARSEDARNALKDTTLKAPFDGIIAKRYVENFEKVQVKQAIAYLQFIDQVEILIDVPELMMARFRSVENIQINAAFDAVAGKEYPLEIKEYSTDADPATQTYQIVLIMDQPDEANILPGMTANVRAFAEGLAAAETTILLPAIAVLEDANQKSYVWTLNSETMTVHKVGVTIGQLEGSKNIFIKEGLEGGESVILAGVSKLREGMKVRPWENQREGK
jgi:multidrug efflux system membrane fusion protein